MLGCMFYAFMTNELNEYENRLPNFSLFIVKIACTIALHLKLFPEVACGMQIMKLANN
jgi:hypothetical protein